MKIAFATTEYITEDNYFGGLANYLYKLALMLHKDGHEVTIFVLTNKNQEMTHEGIKVFRVKQKSLSWLNFMTGNRTKAISDWLIGAYMISSAIKDKLKSQEFDIVQFSSYKGLPYFSSGIANRCIRLSSLEVLWNQHRSSKVGVLSKILERIEAKPLKGHVSVFAPSSLVSTYVEKNLRKQVAVIPSPAEKLRPSEEAKRICSSPYLLYFGKLNHVKGVDLLKSVIPKVLKVNKDIQFIFIGEDELFGSQQMSEYLLADLSLEQKKRIHFFPSMKKNELATHIHHSAAVLMPSRVDNLPNSCLEAMSLGKTVIASNKSSIEEMIQHRVNGFLHEWGNPESIAQVILEVLSLKQSELNVIGENALKRIDDFSPENILPKLYEFYKIVNPKCIP